MSIPIIKHRERVTIHDYRIGGWSKVNRGCGISVECDEHGVPLKPMELSEAAMSNIVRLLFSSEYGKPALEHYSRSYTAPAVGKCECGREVVLGGDSDCECGRWYNAFGQELAHPRYWGEETGERFDDHGNQIVYNDY